MSVLLCQQNYRNTSVIISDNVNNSNCQCHGPLGPWQQKSILKKSHHRRRSSCHPQSRQNHQTVSKVNNHAISKVVYKYVLHFKSDKRLICNQCNDIELVQSDSFAHLHHSDLNSLITAMTIPCRQKINQSRMVYKYKLHLKSHMRLCQESNRRLK